MEQVSVKFWWVSALLVSAAIGCGGAGDEGAAAGADGVAEAEDACGLCGGKADSWQAPAEGSCGAEAMIELANTASFEELDDDARLNARAAEGIVEAREEAAFASLEDVDAASFVGPAALEDLFVYAERQGLIAACEQARGGMIELQLISDIDKTVLPEDSELPFPGVVTLYMILEQGADGAGQLGDTTYVTARKPERVEGMPEWFAEHGLPAGEIETGVTGIPWIAEDEKFKDISAVLERREPARTFVMFGDTSHRDPEAYRRVIEAHPEHQITGLIHRVGDDESEERLAGLHGYDHYPHAAAILAHLGVITEADAWLVFDAAVNEGLELTPDEMQALLAQ